MTASATFSLAPVTRDLRDWLETAVVTEADTKVLRVGLGQAPLLATGAAAPPPYYVLFPQPGTRPDLRPFAGRTLLTSRWQVRSCGGSFSEMQVLADRARVAIAGEDGHGVIAEAIDLSTVSVIRRESMDDGQQLEVATTGLWCWQEHFELDLVPGEPAG